MDITIYLILSLCIAVTLSISAIYMILVKKESKKYIMHATIYIIYTALLIYLGYFKCNEDELYKLVESSFIAVSIISIINMMHFMSIDISNIFKNKK